MLDPNFKFNPAKNKLKTRKLSIVEKRPTLYSLFFPSIYFTLILVVIGLGGLMCIIQIHHRPQLEIRLSSELSKFMIQRISPNLSKEGYAFVDDTVSANPERIILRYKTSRPDGKMIKFSVQIYEVFSKSVLSSSKWLFKLNTDSVDNAGEQVLKRLEHQLNKSE